MRFVRFFLPRIEYILFAAVFWGIAASGPRLLNFDGDLPRHILSGNLILQTHEVPTTDIFSFRTVGHPSYPHEWLSQVILAAASKWVGLSGIILVTALIIMLTWCIVYYETMRQSKSFFVSLLFTALAVAASQIHVLPRPHIFTYLMTAIWITSLEQINESKPRAWWWLPLIMLLWVNLHGMFVIGIIIWGIYLAGDFLDHRSRAWFGTAKARALLAGGTLSLATTFLSPSGPQIWKAITSLGSNTYITSRIPEYQSANFHLPETWPFILILFLLIIGLARTTETMSWKLILLLIVFTGLALYTSRMIPLFAIVATPIAAKVVTSWIRNEYAQSRLFVVERNIHQINISADGRVWILILMLAVTLQFNSGKVIDPETRGNIFDETFFPVTATKWLQAHPPKGHMFNEFDWGGYLLLNLWPEQQIFMDGHTHIYGEELTREYEQIVTLNAGWEEILENYDISWIIVRTNSPLAKTLSTSSNWVISYRDQTAIILSEK
jgi:hypothetical protein